MEVLKINFGFFWPDFDKNDNFFTRILSLKYKVVISDDPDFFFFTHAYNGKREYLKYNCHRIFLGWENERADWTCCDYVLDSDFYEGNPRHKRWPIWAAWQPKRLETKKMVTNAEDKKFCCMVVSNGNATERIDFFKRLSQYKKVDSGGKFLNNIGNPVKNKMEFISQYKFVISFENSSSPGYTTEKLIEPMLTNSIPIYWGNSVVQKDFNINSFVNIPSVDSYDEAIKRIIELDTDEKKYNDLVSEPWFNDNRLPEEFTDQSLANFFDFIVSDSKNKKPVAQSIPMVLMHRAKRWLHTIQWYYRKLVKKKTFR